MNVLMKCGHTAQGKENGKPCCVICFPKKEAFEIVEEFDLKNRIAKCCYCNKETKSDLNLPFFEYKPNEKFDEYYCGCYGWD